MAKLKKLWSANRPIDDIAIEVDTSVSTAYRQATLLDLPKRVVPTHPDNPWSPEAVETLTRMRLAGASSSEIARALGVTASSAIGKASRLKLPRRPSPIIRRAPGVPTPQAKAKAAGAITLEGVRDEPMAPVVFRSAPTSRRCQWPMWPNGTRTKTPVFCDAPLTSFSGMSYCQKHRDAAFGRGTSSERSASRAPLEAGDD